MRSAVNILCTILFYVCSSHAQTTANDFNGTNTIYSASEVDYRLEAKVPTNRTITIGSQVGSLQSNLVFSSSGSDNVTKLYNPTNANEWTEIRGNEKWTYTVTIHSNLWSYSCEDIYSLENTNTLIAHSQSGFFETNNPPFNDNYPIITPIKSVDDRFFFLVNFGSSWMFFSPDEEFSEATVNNAIGDYSCAWGDAKFKWLGNNFTLTNITKCAFVSTNDLVSIQNQINQRVEKSDGTATDLSVSGTLNLNGEPVISAAGVTNVAISLQQLFDTNHYTKAEIDATQSSNIMYEALKRVSASGDTTVNMSGSRPTLVTLTSNATLGVTGLYPYYPAYLMVQGDYSWGFSNATYWVGGAWYQTNRANHYVVWTVGTNLYVNPVTTSEVLP